MKRPLSQRFTFLRSCDVLLFAMSLERTHLWEISLWVPLYVGKPISSNGTYHSTLVTKHLIFLSQFLVLSRSAFIWIQGCDIFHILILMFLLTLSVTACPWDDYLKSKLITWKKVGISREKRELIERSVRSEELRDFTRQDRFILENLLSMLLVKAWIYLK